MSHFSVLVVGPDVEKQLQPFHEFECTGTNDEFVQCIDRTEEARTEFAEHTESRLRRLSDGSLHSYFDDAGNWRAEFSEPDPDRPPFDDKRRRKMVPAGYEAVEVPAEQVLSFAEFLTDWYGWQVVPFGHEPDLADAHKYGYITVNEAGEVVKAVDRTNPNKQWDWWTVGGRWSGFLKLKHGAAGVLGDKGLMGSCADDGPGRADVAKAGDVDFAGMRDEAEQKSGRQWDTARDGISAAGLEPTWRSWEQVRHVDHKGEISAARETYNAQPAMKAASKALGNPRGGIDDYLQPREAFVAAARDRACTTYAIVYRGEWSGKGRMGWFGCSDDKVSQADWNRLFNDLLDGLPGDTLLTVVDCHI